ncbi:MAG TPA: hypothetical protein VL371_19430 [Gemmataceae bacterium]|jgi:hypothetical protein|nr:hypothetical protein [Gemmataceae bacterium]
MGDNPAPPSSSPMKVVPSAAEVCPGDGLAFSVDPPRAPDDWTIKPKVGEIDKQGVYTAPKRVMGRRQIVVTAHAGSEFATATLTLNDGPHIVRFLGGYGVLLALLVGAAVLLFWSALGTVRPVPLVLVNPPVVTLDLDKDQTLPFTATVLGDEKSAVTWTLEPSKAWSERNNGSVDSATGVYKHTASAATVQEGAFSVRATSIGDPSRSGTATLHLVHGAHEEALPQAVSVFPGQQLRFRLGDGSGASWALPRADLGVISADGVFTASYGIRRAEPLQVNAWGVVKGGKDSRIMAASTVVVNPRLADNKAADWRILAFVMVMGALGSMLYFSASFVSYVGNQTFRSTWFWFYISRPFVGGGLAVIFFFLVGSGFVGGGDASDLGKVALISALVGLFSDKAVKKLSDILDTVLATKDDRKDKVASSIPAQPTISAAAPPVLPKGAATTVKLTGTNLAQVKSVKINTRDATFRDVSETGFTVDVTAADAAGDKVTITATGPGGSAPIEIKTS